MALNISAAVGCTKSGFGLSSQLLEEVPLAGRGAGRLEPAAAVDLKGDAERGTGSNGCLATLVAGTLGFAVSTDIPWTGVAIFATNGSAAVSGEPPAVLVSPEVSMALKLAMIFKAGTFVVSPSFFHLREA